MRTSLSLAVLAALLAGAASAKLPAMTDDAKAKAADAAAKTAWSDKVGLYQLCKSMDHVAERYQKSPHPAGHEAHAPTPTPPCADPGPYVAASTPLTPAADKPLEVSGAHSPSGTAISPPSSKPTSAELSGGPKK